MPNWCMTTMTIHPASETKPFSKEMLEKLETAIDTNYLGDDPWTFHESWLGNLLCATGMTPEEVTNGGIRCRGRVAYCETSEEEIYLQVETAWCPQLGAVKKFLDHFGAEAEIIYSAEEPGTEVYYTNDPDEEGSFIFDDFNVGSFYDLSESDLREMLTEKCGKHDEIDNLPVKELIAWALNNYDDLSIHQFENLPIEEWY